MNKLKNGILHIDNRPVFGLGVSYYASFHPEKYPIPECDDKISEMKKDMQDIKANGFNIVSFAALGEITMNGEKVVVNTEFADSMLEESKSIGLASVLRLQGYEVNLKNKKQQLMIDSNGNEMNTGEWSSLIRNTLHNDEIK